MQTKKKNGCFSKALNDFFVMLQLFVHVVPCEQIWTNMIESSKVGKMTEELNNFKRIEKTQIDQYHDKFEEDETGKEDVEDPYFSDPNDQLHSPRITGLTAVSILHQYIQTLPVDRFTKLAPYFEYEEFENNNQIHLSKLNPLAKPFVVSNENISSDLHQF